MTVTQGYARYAIYWAPEPGDLLQAFGAAWLGHEPDATRAPVHDRSFLGLSAGFVEQITADPRHYGLHATLKAPFRLQAAASADDLVGAAAKIATATHAFTTPPLRLSRLHGFLALRPSGACEALDVLAARCVMELDALRAPLDDRERARRKPEGLSPRQRALLDTWGYPYVLSEYGFHITLTGRLRQAEHAIAEPVLAAATMPFCAAPLPIRSIALFGDPGGAQPFQLLQRFALAST
jgi:putative phosphonate metabolism protein